MSDNINFTPDFSPRENKSTIKVIGVGGAGSNAVQHMFEEGIRGVDFLICNTDKDHLDKCQIQDEDKLLIGAGKGAGGKAKVAEEFAAKSEDKIKEFIGDKTEMLFIAAGMGKGTGTGASPIIAKIAKEMGILTVGVVTQPFKFEGKQRRISADCGIDEMSKYVDSMIVINNENLLKYFIDLDIDEAYAQVDDVLKNSVKSIAEIVTCTYKQNVDFEDVKATMKDSGKALLGTAIANGSDRIDKVLEEVLNAPLLENQDITNAKNLLFFITYGPEKKLTMSELSKLEETFEEMESENVHLIWGHGQDDSLGDNIKLSVVVTNFSSANNVIEESYISKPINTDEGHIEVVIDPNARTGNTIGDPVFEIENTDTSTKVEDIFSTENENVLRTNESELMIDETSNTPFTVNIPGYDERISHPENPRPMIGDYVNTWDNDAEFESIVNNPPFLNENRQYVMDNNRQQITTSREEPQMMYELHDDQDDLFRNLAD